MAQAARLSLRMQKELKLLLSDPPPGVSLPLLLPDSGLSSIDADIEGPGDTVYAKGIFRLKIQIPERYPFQPPNVTFATPIYHPNIDNGGRICLDILNLPPKGSWQPSLNISTVLTSIGLLLSEPNPDDGLMCEASREYKYNRQAFDQKARTMTEKYARAGANGNKCGDPHIQLNSKQSTVECAEMPKEVETKSIQKKFWGMSRKLSLDASSSVESRDGNMDAEKKPNPHSLGSGCKRSLSIEGTKEEQTDSNDTHTHAKLDQTKQKLSLESRSDVASYNSKGTENDSSDSRNKVDLGARGKKLSLGLKGQLRRTEKDNKENILPVKKFQLPRPMNASPDCGIAKEFSLSPLTDLEEIECNNSQPPLSLKASKDLRKSDVVYYHGAGEMPASDMVIVLDSESEDEDEGSSRQKGLLGRKRLKNWKPKA